jgi:hypothetical protein
MHVSKLDVIGCKVLGWELNKPGRKRHGIAFSFPFFLKKTESTPNRSKKFHITKFVDTCKAGNGRILLERVKWMTKAEPKLGPALCSIWTGRTRVESFFILQ